MRRDVRKRANAEECLNHPWLKMITRAEEGEGGNPISNVAKDNMNQQKSAHLHWKADS